MKNILKENIRIYALGILVLILATTSLILYAEGNEKEQRIANLENQLAQKEEKVTKANVNYLGLRAAFDEQTTEYKDALSIIKQTDEQSKSLVADNQKLNDTIKAANKELKKMQKRLDKYEHYDYVLFTKSGNRTDVTYDQIVLGEKLMEAKGYDPDLLFSMIMVESGGNENAKNSGSTATGYGQFLNGTGKFVYENLLGGGYYSHTYAQDGDTNIKMMSAYLDYLIQRNDNNLYCAIRNYRGTGGTVLAGYLAKIDSYLNEAGTSFNSVSASIQSNDKQVVTKGKH